MCSIRNNGQTFNANKLSRKIRSVVFQEKEILQAWVMARLLYRLDVLISTEAVCF